jgi:hypothetical protein
MRQYSSRRGYPLQLPFSYIARRHRHTVCNGWGETLEIGSSHVRVFPVSFAISDITDVVLSIAWPAKLPDGTPLQLVVQAKPIGESLAFAEFQIVKHEFRTASRGMRAGLRDSKSDTNETPPQCSAASGM